MLIVIISAACMAEFLLGSYKKRPSWQLMTLTLLIFLIVCVSNHGDVRRICTVLYYTVLLNWWCWYTSSSWRYCGSLEIRKLYLAGSHSYRTSKLAF